MLTVPYCTTGEFIEYPTLLDVLGLRSGDLQPADQTAILHKLLMMSTRWVDSYVEMGAEGTLTAHQRTENKRIRPDRHGRILWHPDHIPVVSVSSLQYGPTLGSLTTYNSPAAFIEDGRTIVLDLSAATTSWSGSLQFGGPPPGRDSYATLAYIAGYPNTLLTSDVIAGATSLPVGDTTGVQPGDALRIFDPGLDEPVTVASTWAPATGPGSLPLTAGLAGAHTTTTPTRVSVMPHDVFEASALYTIALLMRPDSSAEDAFPDMRGGISTRLADSRKDGSGLIFEAEHLLEPYRRVF
ncbi:MAG TPA: hypothetical protein VGJ13_05250 [Pseudonocardiaceae bacterium]